MAVVLSSRNRPYDAVFDYSLLPKMELQRIVQFVKVFYKLVQKNSRLPSDPTVQCAAFASVVYKIAQLALEFRAFRRIDDFPVLHYRFYETAKSLSSYCIFKGSIGSSTIAFGDFLLELFEIYRTREFETVQVQETTFSLLDFSYP